MYAIGINIAPVCYIKHGLSKYDVELHCIVQRARDDYLQTIDEVIKTFKNKIANTLFKGCYCYLMI